MTPKERAAMQQALEALEKTGIEGTWLLHDEAITALREALAEQAEQEPVFISNEQFRSMHFSKVTVYTQNDGKEVIVCTPIRTHIEGFWCEDLTCAKCYTADFRLKHTATPRTKDLTDYEIVRLYAESPMCDSEMIEFARAVIAAFKEKNK